MLMIMILTIKVITALTIIMIMIITTVLILILLTIMIMIILLIVTIYDDKLFSQFLSLQHFPSHHQKITCSKIKNVYIEALLRLQKTQLDDTYVHQGKNKIKIKRKH